MLTIAMAFATVAGLTEQLRTFEWAQQGDPAEHHPGFGGWWLLYVGRPIFLIFLLGWLWRMLLLILFWRVSKLDLVIVPTHPDRRGGLGFLAPTPTKFAALVLAISAVLDAGRGHDVVYHEVALTTLCPQMNNSSRRMLAAILLQRPRCRPPSWSSISDRASTGIYEDKGIPALEEWLGAALTTPWRSERRLIADDRPTIDNTLRELVDRDGCHLLLTTGGTVHDGAKYADSQAP